MKKVYILPVKIREMESIEDAERLIEDIYCEYEVLSITQSGDREIVTIVVVFEDGESI